MSLINQVLKDLEQRHANEMAAATNSLDGLALASPHFGNARARNQHGGLKLLLSALIIGSVIAGAWWWQQYKSAVSPQPVAAKSDTPRAVAPAPAIAPETRAAPAPQAEAAAVTVTTKVETAPPPAVAVVKPPRQSKATVTVPETETVADSSMEKAMVPLRREQKAELAYQAGYDQLQKHNTLRAERELRQALAIEPAHLRARELLTGMLIKQGRWVETVEILQQGVSIAPAHSVFVKLYARALMQLNRDQEAITVLRAHAPTIAQDPEHHALLAALYQRQQNHHAAANIYREILQSRPDAGLWWVGLGISLEALGKQAEAQQAYTRARQTGTLQTELARYTDNRLLALDAIKYPID